MTASTEDQSLHIDLAIGHDNDVVPKALRPCSVRILDTTTGEFLSLPGRIHSWTTVSVSFEKNIYKCYLKFLTIANLENIFPI